VTAEAVLRTLLDAYEATLADKADKHTAFVRGYLGLALPGRWPDLSQHFERGRKAAAAEKVK
jgi:hypothetical protein